MKRLIFLTLIFSQFLNSYCQKEITNIKTDNHKQVRGTKVFIIPPDGFIEANNFFGFQQSQSSSSIVITEVPGPFETVSKGLNADGLKTQGMTLKEKREIKINGYDGFYIEAEQFAYENYFTKSIIVFGDKDLTIMIVAIFPQKFKSIEKDILKSIYSVVYEPNLEIDVTNSIHFNIETENTKMRFAKIIMGSLTYSVDGKIPPESDDKTFFQVGQSLSTVEVADKKLYTLNRARKMPFNDLRIEENKTKMIEVDGISGYEIVAYGINQKTAKEELLYIAMLYTDNGYYLLNGTANADYNNNIDLFRKLTQSFKRK